MQNLTIYGLLYQASWSITAMILLFSCIGILFIMRDCFEKLPYNISVASQQGDFFLIIGYIMVGVEILKRQTHLPEWTTDAKFNLPAIAISTIIAGMFYHYGIVKKPNEKQTMADTYHDIIIVPLLVILIGLVSPLIWLYGSAFEKTFSTCCLLVWPMTMYFDYNQGRLNQTKWLLEKGLPGFHKNINEGEKPFKRDARDG